MALLMGGGAAALAVLAGLGFVLTRHAPVSPPATTPATMAAPGGAPADVARQAVAAALPGLPCSWLDLTRASAAPGGAAVRLAGVAGSPAAVQAAVAQAGSGAGVTLTDINLDDVAPVGQAVCPPLNAFRTFRADVAATGRHISSQQVRYPLAKQQDGVLSADAILNITAPASGTEFELLGLDPDGSVTAITPDRASFEALARHGTTVHDQGGGNYRLDLATTGAGWKGVMLLTARSLAGADLLAAPVAARGTDWASRVEAAAKVGGWGAEMVWYRVEPS